MSYYHTCPYCGAALDPGEPCDCLSAMYSRLTPENRDKLDAMVTMLLKGAVKPMRRAPYPHAAKQRIWSRTPTTTGRSVHPLYQPPTRKSRRKNMIYPYSKTTQKERTAISNAMWPIFTGLEQAQTLLNTCLEDHFEDYPQKAITESEAAWLADMLHIVNTVLEDSIMSFKLSVGWERGTEWFDGSMDEHRRVLELNAVNSEIADIWRKLPVEQRKPIEGRRKNFDNADDETALKEARALLEEVKALYIREG